MLVEANLVAKFASRFYRYATLPELLDLVQRRTITFSHPSVWPDKYEKHAMDRGFGTGMAFEQVRPFVKCFSSEFASEAMWRLYAVGGPVFRYGFTLSRLLQWLKASDAARLGKIYVGEVRYMKPAAIRRDRESSRPKSVSKEAAQWLLKKRLGFSFEREVRVVIAPGKKVTSNFLEVSSTDALPLRRILIDPYLPEWQFKSYESLLSDTVGVDCRVQQSAFDHDPSML